MKDRLLFRTIVITLVLLGLVIATHLTSFAQPRPPSPPPTTSSAVPRTGSYQAFLPIIFSVSAPAIPLKKGVPLTYDDCPSVSTMKAYWEFSWDPTPPNCAGVENVPMIWGAVDMDTPLGGNSDWIMGFNEPDTAWQANLSPAQAAALWRQIEQRYPTRKLLSPVTGNDPNWLPNFRDAYISAYGTAPRLNGLAMHCYAWYASQCIPRTQQLETLASTWGATEVWVTEFSFATTSPSSPDRSLQEQQLYIDWMVAERGVTRYAWFASKIQGNEWWIMNAFLTPLVDWSTGQPTQYGSIYLPYH